MGPMRVAQTGSPRSCSISNRLQGLLAVAQSSSAPSFAQAAGLILRQAAPCEGDMPRLWREAGILDRVRITNGPVRVIAPTRQIAAGVPTDACVEWWLALEDRFRLRGEAISFLGALGTMVARMKNDPAAPVNGPFSADFCLEYLDGDDGAPIRCTRAQADVSRAICEFEGKNRSAEDVMTRAERKSSKPIDVFKAHPEPKRA
ncbi:MAG: hypothetical protein IT475_14755 [Aquimonas sp.]|jgi:hypothetical protein|nr:hypothetical protein [Aquimonas sp.]